MGRLEVFEAKIVAGGAMVSSSDQRRFLRSRSSVTASITIPHSARSADVGGKPQALEGTIARGGIELSLLDQLGQRLLDAPPALVKQLGRDVTNCRGEARGPRRLRDAAAHESATQNAHGRDLS